MPPCPAAPPTVVLPALPALPPAPALPPTPPSVHTPPAHDCPGVQALPHEPQFAALLIVLTHTPLHVVFPAGQPQTPAAQACPPAQTFVQKPQLVGSVARTAQLELQFSSPAAHMLEQTPCEQTWPAVHTLPQAPQFSGSERRLTQLCPHASRPAVHAHRPATQLWLAPHSVPHMPQFLKSVRVSTQTPEQVVWPLMQEELPAVPLPPLPLPPVPSRVSSRGSGEQAMISAVARVARARLSKAGRVRARMLRSLHGFAASPTRPPEIRCVISQVVPHENVGLSAHSVSDPPPMRWIRKRFRKSAKSNKKPVPGAGPPRAPPSSAGWAPATTQGRSAPLS